MPWDEELERLMRFVHEHFGGQELEAVVDRAMASAARRQSLAADLLADGGTIASAIGTVIAMDAYWRELARPPRLERGTPGLEGPTSDPPQTGLYSRISES